MKMLLLAVDKDDASYYKQLAQWRKYEVEFVRALSMSKAIELSRNDEYIAVGINADNIEYLPQLRILRDSVDAPIHIITSNYSHDDHLKALGLGADVYSVKNENIEEGVQRGFNTFQKMSQRRPEPKSVPSMFRYDNIHIFPEYYKVFINDKEVELRKKEFELLLYLAANRGRILTFEQILSQLWGVEFDNASHQLLWSQIRNLRRKISPLPNSREYIKCIKNVGYGFVTEFDK